MRKLILAFLCLINMFTLVSCSDAKEIDEWAYVYSIGIDKGVADKYRYTFQLPILGGETGQSSQGGFQAQAQDAFTVISVDAPTLYAATNMVNSSLAKTVSYTHAKYIMVSEELARHGVESFINGMIRSRQIRRSMNIIVVKGSAREFVKILTPVTGMGLSKLMEKMIDQEHETGLFDSVTYNEFVNNMKSSYRQSDAALAAINDFSHFNEAELNKENNKSEGDYQPGQTPRSGGNKFEFLGSALFNGDKMIGELNGDETRAMLMMRGDFSRGSITIPDPLEPDRRISVETHPHKGPAVNIYFDGDKPVIDVKVYLEGDLLNVQSEKEYESEELNPLLEQTLEELIKKDLDKTIDKCKALNCDVFGFGEKAVTQFLTIQEWEKYNWISRFKECKVTTGVNFIIRRTGTMTKTNPVKTSNGGEK
ncbi:spore germination protein B3 precursor [Oxobacter pfennigii]|uniref:Spore germination protein B3 n=1 Tax=Oxobacter pfennigii TaxID=36849 RepID=A0A0P8W800_9CLOT|nr:Ger(x)C family spore germination protein [Oxobacter pfennigii]KPU44802.1 spore germination protein B3 precursor [Oxobacter pfennigii]